VSPPRRADRAGREGPPDDDWPPSQRQDGGADDEEWEQWERERRQPLPVEGGLTAATRRGQIGGTWWSRRFLDALEPVLVGGRMASGRAYARKGQVVALNLRAGVVEAPVQGSREDPYEVRLTIPVVPDESWERIIERLASQAGYAARMLAGDLPHEIDEVFEAEGESLLPAPHSRLTTSCTCPDFENPCKHVAAACYLLAEAFDRDPFELLAWRGRAREDILAALRVRRRAGAETDAPATAASPRRTTELAAPPAAHDGTSLGHLDAGFYDAGFYDAGPELDDVRVAPVVAAIPDAVVRQLPRGVLEVDGVDVRTLLAPAYEVFSADAARRGTCR